MSTKRPSWEREGRDWPNRQTSRFVRAGALRWHVQEMGPPDAPLALLVHGTGAATHSWRALGPILARRFRVVAPDMPGHGFTDEPRSGGLSLPGMANALDELLKALEAKPALVVGHSAGVAILAKLCLDGRLSPQGLVSLNGALKPFPGFAGAVFPGLARLLFVNPFAPRLFSWLAADQTTVERLIRDTGSRIDAGGLDLYARLFRSPGHVAGTLGMMANWDLKALARDLPKLRTPTLLIAGANDKAIPPEDSANLAKTLPDAQLEILKGLGHLAHEEKPELVAELVFRFAEKLGVLPA